MEDERESALRRRARHQALVLLTASAAVSIMILYGIWVGLRGFL